MFIHCNVNSRGQRLVQLRSNFLAEARDSVVQGRCEMRSTCSAYTMGTRSRLQSQSTSRETNKTDKYAWPRTTVETYICLNERHKDGEYLSDIKSPDDYYTYSFFYHGLLQAGGSPSIQIPRGCTDTLLAYVYKYHSSLCLDPIV
ncbi:hypothetical protein FVEG_16190 [Fusarium verticillioides 7600]|uniref:Uncharacterized protein n=1 Tax=Gibberella moniliformis (strain M3125 / FGSC 7600) TaxID=334819 RepID=W7MTC2_GIBM7|nr:hypothetical protein FVEG_16190 [Fusarium verticillioides 7600]EWG47822.1 hypothetical protein FVEG_16190 [Fusarium verticillioides 7600]